MHKYVFYIKKNLLNTRGSSSVLHRLIAVGAGNFQRILIQLFSDPFFDSAKKKMLRQLFPFYFFDVR